MTNIKIKNLHKVSTKKLKELHECWASDDFKGGCELWWAIDKELRKRGIIKTKP